MKRRFATTIFLILMVSFYVRVSEHVNAEQRLLALAPPTSTTIENPIGFENLNDLLARIGEVLLAIGIPLAAIMIAWGGWLRMTARGDTEQVTQSNNTIKYAIIGLIILIMAQGIVSLVQDLLQVKTPVP